LILLADKNEKVVFKIFDARNSGAKRAHNCNLCQIYKREIVKGNNDALVFYKDHINEFVKKYNGATIVLPINKKLKALPAQKGA
jgi:hypothetical protein